MVDVEKAFDSSGFKGSVMRKAKSHKSQKIKFLITAVLLLAISWIGYWIGYGSHSWHDAASNPIDQGGKLLLTDSENGNFRKPIRGGGQGSIIEEDQDIDKLQGVNNADLKKRARVPPRNTNPDNIVIISNNGRPNIPDNHNNMDSHRHAQLIHQSHAQHISNHINSKFLKGLEDAAANPNIKNPQSVFPARPIPPRLDSVHSIFTQRPSIVKEVIKAVKPPPPTKKVEEITFDPSSPFYTVIHSEVPTKIHRQIHDKLPRIEEHVDRESYVFQSQELPKNLDFLPEVGNGHIASRIHGDYICMNNLYSGYKEQSHRAEIPSTVNVNITDIEPPTNYTRNYSLNVAEGVFTETLYNENFTINHRTYAHRSITRLFVLEIDLTLHVSPSPITAIKLKFPRFSTSLDLTFTQYLTNISKEVSYKKGRINSPETDSLVYSEVHVYYDHVPLELKPIAGSGRVKWIFLSAFGNTKADALTAYREGQRLALLNDQLYALHVRSWMDIWRRGRIDISGNLPLAQAAYGSLYYLMSSLPTKHDPVNPFAGLSPGGLAHGIFNKDYMGHVFWDQETWMLPPILLFHPEIAKLMLSARVRRLHTAKLNAAKNNHDGAQYPWESAFTGIDVTPDKNMSLYEQHISGDISLAVQQYLRATRDRHFVGFEGAGDMLVNIANFWVSRLARIPSSALSGVMGVMGPDEDHFPVDNSAYTNAIAKIALTVPSEAYALLNITVQPAWRKYADKIYIPYDEKNKYHPEFDGYKLDTEVKQADVVLLGYPLMLKMNHSVRANDLLKYEKVIRPNGPAMSWSMYSVGWLELKQYLKAETCFLKGLRYIQGPFQVWSEETGGQGALNFLTGMGGFLQSILNGYMGIRLHADRMDFDPVLLPKSKLVSLIGVNYLGSSFDFHINDEHIHLEMTSHDGAHSTLCVYMYSTGAMHALALHEKVRLKREKSALMVYVSGRTP